MAAIECAIVAAANSPDGGGSGSGGTVYFPPGIYSIDKTIDLNGLGQSQGRRDGVRLLGASASPPVIVGGGAGGGTVLQAVSGIDAGTNGGPVIRGDAMRVSIENMTLDGNGLANPVLQFWYLSTGILVQNVVLTGGMAAVGGACQSNRTCTSLVQLDGTRADQGTQLCEGGICEVADIVFQNVLFNSINSANNISDYDLDVYGSNTFPIMVRDSVLYMAKDLVHVASGASINLDNDELEPPTSANGSIRVDSTVQHMTVSNCYTEVPGPNFFWQGSVQQSDIQSVITLTNNQINANAPIVFVPNQMMVLDGNLFKGNVNINAGGSGYGAQTVVAVGNQFGAGAGFAGTALGQLQQLGTVSTGGAVSSTLSTLSLASLSGPTSVTGLLQLQNGGGIAYRVATGGNQNFIPAPAYGPLNFDEIRAPVMLQDATWDVDSTGVTTGARIRFVKDSTVSTDSHTITIVDKVTGSVVATLNSAAGSTGWVELVLLSGSPNYWARSAYGGNWNANSSGQIMFTAGTNAYTQALGIAEPDTNYRVLLTPTGATGSPAAGSNRVQVVSKAAGYFTVLIEAAPGTGASVTFDWQVFR